MSPTRLRPPAVPDARDKTKPPSGSKTVDARSGTLLRGLAILDILLPAAQPMTLGEIAAQTGLDLSTTLRIVRALEDNGRVIRSSDGKRYLPSPSILRPLSLLHPLEQLRREAYPMLAELAERVAQTVILVVYLGSERLVVEVVQTPGSLSPYYTTWLKGPLHASAPGKALLLTMDAAQRSKALGAPPYPRWTDKTTVDKKRLDKELAGSAETGVVLVRDEYYQGLSAMAANFHGWEGRALGCIGVTGHSAQFTDEAIDSICTALRNCARLMPLQAGALRALEQMNAR